MVNNTPTLIQESVNAGLFKDTSTSSEPIQLLNLLDQLLTTQVSLASKNTLTALCLML